MLEHLGAYDIDANALGHRAIAKDAPGYQQVLDTFGNWILAPDEQVDRAKLARILNSSWTEYQLKWNRKNNYSF